MARELLIILALPLFAAGSFVAARRPEVPLLAALVLIAAEGSIRAFLGYRTPDMVAGLLLCFMAGTVVRLALARRHTPIVMWPVLLPIAGFVALTIAGIPAAQSIRLGIASFRDAAVFMLVGLIMAVGISDRASWRRLLHGIVVITLLVGAYATFRWIVGPAERELATVTVGNDVVRVDGRVGVFGSFTTRGSLARWCTHAIPLCLAMVVLGRGAWRGVSALAGILCTIALVGTEARITLVATMAAVVLVLVLQSSVRARPGLRLGTTLAVVVGTVAVGVAAFTIVSESAPGSAERYSRILTPTEDHSYGVRQTRWPEALEIVSDHPLGLGLGVAGRQASSQRYVVLGATNTDNAYIQVAIEQGLPALFLLVLGLVVLVIGLARQAIRATDPEHAAAALGASASLVALFPLMYTGLSLGAQPVMIVWAVVGLALSARLIGLTQAARSPILPLAQPQPAS